MGSIERQHLSVPSFILSLPARMRNLDEPRSDRAYWTRRTAELLDYMDSLGEPVVLLSKADGYRAWWESVAAFVATLVMWLGSDSWKAAKRRFTNDYHSVFGRRVYWGAGRPFDAGNLFHYALLRHECVHILQRRRHGAFGFTFLYLFALPAVFTMRSWYEVRAYREQVRAYLEAGQFKYALETVEFVRNELRGSSYFWMRPFASAFDDGGEVEADILRVCNHVDLMGQIVIPWGSEFHVEGGSPMLTQPYPMSSGSDPG